MSIPREEPPEAGVLVFIDADSKADIEAFLGWTSVGLLKGPPERLAEGVFVATLSPGVHDVVGGTR